MRKLSMQLIKSILTILVIMNTQKVYAQNVQTWEEVGPNNFGGRTTAIAIDANNHIYVGSVGGGLWKSTDQGYSWKKLSGFNDNLMVSHIFIDGTTMYVSTGDLIRNAKMRWGTNSNFNNNHISNFANGYFGYSGMPGKGVYISTDGGNTFSNNNATWDANCTDPTQACYFDPNLNPFLSVQKVAKDKNGRIYIATYAGLYFSDDNLATVTRATLKDTSGNDRSTQPIIDIEITENKVYVSSVGNPANVFVQENFTGDFVSIINKFSDMFSNTKRPVRFEVAISPQDPNYVYIGIITTISVLRFGGVVMSKDGGQTFTKIAPESVPGVFSPTRDGYGWYAFCMAVDPKNKNRLLVGGSSIWEYTENTGWTVISKSSQSFVGDNKYSGTFLSNIVYNPNPGKENEFWVTGAREIVASFDNGKTYTVRTKSYNSAHVSYVQFGANEFDAYAVLKEGGIIYKNNPSAKNQEFQLLKKLNDGKVFVSKINPNFVLYSGEGGTLLSRSLNGGDLFETFYGYPKKDSCNGVPHPTLSDTLSTGSTPSPSVPVCATFIEYPTVAPTIDADGFHYEVQDASGKRNYKTYAFVHNYLHEHIWVVFNPFGGPDSLPTWNKISYPDPVNEGDANDRVTCMTVSRDGNFTLYVGTRTGKIWRITNANDLCNRTIQKISNNLPNRWVTSITVHPNDPNTILVTYGSYDFANQNNGRIYVSNDALSASPTFRDVTGSFPKYPVYTALFAPTTTIPSPRNWKVLIGTEIGVYASNEDLTNPSITDPQWFDYNSSETKNVPVISMDMKMFNRRVVTQGTQTQIFLDEAKEKHVLIGTYGRGMFILRDWPVSKESAHNRTNSFNAYLYPNPAQNQAFISFELTKSSDVQINLLDINGKTIFHETKTYHSGKHLINVNSENLSNGVYFIQLKSKEDTQTLKLVIQK